MADTTPIISSGFFNLNYRDFVKSALVSVLSTILPIIFDTFSAGSFTLDWKSIGTVAASTFVGYLIKQLLGSKEVIIKGLNESQTSGLKTGISSLKLVDAKKVA